MTEIQMTETLKKSVLNIEEFGFWSLFRISIMDALTSVNNFWDTTLAQDSAV